MLDEDTFSSILYDISQGSSLTKAVKNSNATSWQSFYDTLDASPERREQYARAVRSRTSYKFESIQDIAEAATPRDAHVARVRIDAIKWQLSKEEPRKYGDKPAEINVNTQVNVAVVSEADRQALINKRKAIQERQQ
jgi:hypothetical protein